MRGRGALYREAAALGMALQLLLLWGAASSTQAACPTWTPKLNMPTARVNLAVAVLNGEVYAIGGSDGTDPLNTVEAYDPATDMWTTKAPLPVALWAPAAAVVNGKLYVIGGSDNTSTFATVDTVYEYDPVGDAWITKAPMPTPRGWLSLGVANDGSGDKIYAIGGYEGNVTFLDLATVEEYDPVADSWTTVASMLTARETLAVGVVNGKIYAAGGYDYIVDVIYDTVEEYDPVGDTWTPKAALPAVRVGPAGGVANGKFYVIGGADGGWAIQDSVYEYDLGNDAWVTKAPLPTARLYHGVGVVDDTLYAIGGNNGSWLIVPTVEAGAFTRVAVVKTQTPANPQIGEPVMYQIVVTNTGGPAIDSLMVVDTVSPVIVGVTTEQPPGFAPVVTQVAGGTRYEWSYSFSGMMPAGTSLTFKVMGKMGVVCAPTAVSNTAYIIAGNTCTTTRMFTNAVGTVVQPPVTGITVVKIQTPLTYQIVVTNTGTATIENLIVVDTVAPEVTGVTQDQPSGFTALGPAQLGSGTWYAWSGSGLSLTPGQSFTFTITGAAGVVCSQTMVSNKAYISVSSVCNTTAMGTNQTTFTLDPLAVLESTLSFVPGNPLVDELVQIVLTVSNTGGISVSVNTAELEINSGASLLASLIGPDPTVPWTVAAGTMQTFTWTTTVSGAGLVAFTGTATGTGGGCTASASETASLNALATFAELFAALSVTPGTVVEGDLVEVVLTVTNTGGEDAINVLPSLEINAGAGNVTLQAGPSPTGPLTITANSSATFTWIYSTTGPGTVDFTATGAGTDAGSGAPREASGSASLTINPPAAALVASLAVSPNPSTVDQAVVEVVLTVVNTGKADATGVTPALSISAGASLVAYVSGPAPAGPVTLSKNGGARSFTWQYDPSAEGSVAFVATASGIDDGSNSPISVNALATLVISSKAVLASTLTFTPLPAGANVYVGGSVTVDLTVMNTGLQDATGVMPALVINAGSPPLTLLSGPTPPGPETIGSGGGAVVFSWTYQVDGSGTLSVSVTATGADGMGGTAFTSQIGSVTLLNPAILNASLSVAPTVGMIGQWVDVVLTVVNIGQADATGVTSGLDVNSGGSLLNLENAPNPTPVTIAVGASQKFTWTYSVSDCGSVAFTGTATGIDSALSGSVSASASWPDTLGEPGCLAAAVSVSPSTVKQGDEITVTLTVTNEGGTRAWDVKPSAGAGPLPAELVAGPTPTGTPWDPCTLDPLVAGPTPAGIPWLDPGGSVTFTWTYRASKPGVGLTFTAFATGTEMMLGTPLSAAATTPPVVITSAAMLCGSATLWVDPDGAGPKVALPLGENNPEPFRAGTTFELRFTVSNTGATVATGVTITPPKGGLFLNDPSLARIDLGPLPSDTVDLGAAGAPNSATVFVWTLTALNREGGTLTLTASATGFDSTNQVAVGATAQVVQTIAGKPEPGTGGAVAYPNPVHLSQPSPKLNIYLQLNDDAREITVDVYDAAMHRVYSGVWGQVPKIDGTLEVEGLNQWAPGIYLLRAKAKLEDGTEQKFPVMRVMVK